MSADFDDEHDVPLPDFDYQAAGVGFIEDAHESAVAVENQWADYLQVCIAEQHELKENIKKSLRTQDASALKAQKEVAVRLDRIASGVQSLIGYFRSLHR